MREYLVDVLDWAGADAVEAEELAVIPGLDEVFALADIKAFATSRRVRRRRRRLRADRGDDPAALAARRPRLVHGAGLRDAAPASRSSRVRCSTGSRQLPIAGDRVFAAVRRFYDRLDGVRDLLIDGDDHERATRRQPRAHGRRRSAPHVHVPVAVRLPRRRGDREPHAARPRSPIRGSRAGRRCSPRTSSSSRTRSRPLPVLAAELAGRRARRACDELADVRRDVVRRSRSREPARRRSNRSASMPSARRWCCRCTSRSPSATT